LERKSSVLVLANRTAVSAGLESALLARTQNGPARFTLVVPLGRSAEAQQTALAIASRLNEAGLDVKGVTGNTDPLIAVLEAWNPAEFDEIIVSTLPAWKSRWMKTGLPQRIERHTGALVRHFEAREMPPLSRQPTHHVA
jgi:hypothetical protein